MSGKSFVKIRPDFLKNEKTGSNLELDFFNKELKIAVEYNGKQHYKFIPFFHKKYAKFEKMKESDKIKRKLCQEKGILLIIIPYWIKPHNIGNEIRRRAIKFGVSFYFKMKIPNYDIKQNNNSSRRLNDIFDEDFRLLIAGQTRCGKTSTLMHILRKPVVYYDKIYIYSPNEHQDKIQDFKKLMDSISEKVGYPILEFGGIDKIRNTNEYPSNDRKVVVFDDLVNAPEKMQNKIANHYTDGRHHGISPIYSSQSYYDVPQKLRHNCSNMILYPPSTKNHINLIAKENLIDAGFFDKLKPFEFLFLDKQKKSVMKNFDEAL